MNDVKKNKRALLFGAMGFVGKYLSRELAGNGYEVFGSDLIEFTGEGSFDGYFRCDLLDAKGVSALLEEVRPTHVVNLAAISSVGLSWKIPGKTVEVNVCGTINILEAARQHCPDAKILLIGSSEEYEISDQPLSETAALSANNPYGISKSVQESFSELYRARYGMSICRVRAFNHTGVGQADTFVIPSWCRQAAEISAGGQPGVMRVGNTQVCRDFSHVEDVVRAYRLILEKGSSGAVYNVGSGRAVRLSELLEYIVSLSEQPIDVCVDEELFRPADNPVICCDNRLIRSQLGWEPEYSIYDAVRQMFHAYTEEIKRR